LTHSRDGRFLDSGGVLAVRDERAPAKTRTVVPSISDAYAYRDRSHGHGNADKGKATSNVKECQDQIPREELKCCSPINHRRNERTKSVSTAELKATKAGVLLIGPSAHPPGLFIIVT